MGPKVTGERSDAGGSELRQEPGSRFEEIFGGLTAQEAADKAADRIIEALRKLKEKEEKEAKGG